MSGEVPMHAWWLAPRCHTSSVTLPSSAVNTVLPTENTSFMVSRPLVRVA